MYHIKRDKRSAASAKLLCDGLADMLKSKNYSDISISDICSSCGIARTTFYRLFDTLDDILLYQFDTLFEESIAQYQKRDDRNNSSYARIILHIALLDPALITTLVSSGRSDLFDFATRLKEDVLIRDMQIEIDPVNRRYCTAMLNAMMLAALKTWIENGCKETADELYQILKSNLLLIQRHI